MDEFYIEKNGIDNLDYVVNFTKWLGDDSISAVTTNPVRGGVIVQSASRNESQMIDNGKVIEPRKGAIVWIYGGVPGAVARIRVTISTALGRTKSVMLIVTITS